MSHRAGIVDYVAVCFATGEVLEGGRAMRLDVARMVATMETIVRHEELEKRADSAYRLGLVIPEVASSEACERAIAERTFHVTPAFLVAT